MPPDFVFTLPPAGIFAAVFLCAGGFALALHRLFLLPRLKHVNERLADLSTAIVAVSGAVFGLSVTFLANTVWAAEDRARETVNAEARSLRVMEIYMESMTGPTRESLARLLTGYAGATASEWKTMAQDGGSPAAEAALRSVYAAVIQGFAEGEQNRLLQQRMLAALDTLSAARQQRLSMAQEVVSVGQWLLVSGLGALLLTIVALAHARFPLARRVALAAVTTAVSIMLFVIILHDRPFTGHAAVSPGPILRAAKADD